ncbi:unnamed protein product [Acanthocheilonema viteae]|uniref:Reverse transcriptase domain-containing protein n=1 Tax=Acanthocheilonema viteae TaxID=6277 RepID=A0A498SLY1_ACAVI|nr:unnamed protein product [Acanthocheilonema viteae]
MRKRCPRVVEGFYRDHPGERGVALVCDSDLSMHQLEQSSDRFPDAPLIMMGDWNMTKKELKAWLSTVLPLGSLCNGLDVLNCDGCDSTFHRSNCKNSAIDFIICNSIARSFLSSCRVDRGCDLSDHYPISALFCPSNTIVNTEKKNSLMYNMNRNKVVANKESIVCHNRFDILSDLESEDVNATAENFESAVKLVSSDLHLMSRNKKPARLCLSKKTRKAIKIKNSLFKMCQCKGSSMADLDAYKKARKGVTNLIKTEKKNKWFNHIANGAEFRKHEPRMFFRWLKNLVGVKSYPKLGPLKDKNGVLQVTPEKIAEVWREHYRNLFEDSTGHSKNKEYWSKFPIHIRSTVELSNIPFSWSEIVLAVRSLSTNKAAGPDGIPAEFFKLINNDMDTGLAPCTKLGKFLFSIFEKVWVSGKIPNSWNLAKIISIPKKGDLTITDNYRGISLIPVISKILSKMLSSRISYHLESNGIICKEQAGFRKREECLGQVIALVEAIQRRKHKGEPTYLAFIDFKKAYDMVAHEALFLKMTGVGISGKTLDLIKDLYKNSSIITSEFDNSPITLMKESWAYSWDMVIGANKCGIMELFPIKSTVKDFQWTLQNNHIAVVDSYRYLDLYSIIFKNRSIPFEVKLKAYFSCILPVLTYGSEVFGLYGEKLLKPLGEFNLSPVQRIGLGLRAVQEC